MPLPNLPQRQSLVAQTVVFLSARIASGEWCDFLPSERALCELLQVSRNTLRAALAQMAAAKKIRPQHGTGNRILVGRGRAVRRSRAQDVALLTPEPIERLRPMQSLWIDDMRALLSERGFRLRVIHGHQYFAATPAAALRKLVARNPHGCWILLLAGEHVQRWFGASGIPCLVAGSTYAGVDLPFRDLDHRVMCRHAAGILLGLGHRRLVMLTQKSRKAGDVASENGFVEGARQSRHENTEAVIIYHDETIASVAQAVRRILKLQPRPTAIMVVHPHYYLAVASRLALEGVRIPQEISLISRDDDPFLSFLVPAPARYAVSPHAMARSLLPPVLELLEGHTVTQRASLIMPKFFRGESIAAAKGHPEGQGN